MERSCIFIGIETIHFMLPKNRIYPNLYILSLKEPNQTINISATMHEEEQIARRQFYLNRNGKLCCLQLIAAVVAAAEVGRAQFQRMLKIWRGNDKRNITFWTWNMFNGEEQLFLFCFNPDVNMEQLLSFSNIFEMLAYTLTQCICEEMFVSNNNSKNVLYQQG